jgi:hypothetical protein
VVVVQIEMVETAQQDSVHFVRSSPYDPFMPRHLRDPAPGDRRRGFLRGFLDAVGAFVDAAITAVFSGW